MKDEAVLKLQNEDEKFKGNKAAEAMRKNVLEALKKFCEQDEEFAQAIVQSDKTFSDCMDAVAKNVGSSISDIDAYRRAVQFYFPGAEIRFSMTIDLIGAAHEPPITMTSGSEKSVLEISLDELF